MRVDLFGSLGGVLAAVAATAKQTLARANYCAARQDRQLSAERRYQRGARRRLDEGSRLRARGQARKQSYATAGGPSQTHSDTAR